MKKLLITLFLLIIFTITVFAEGEVRIAIIDTGISSVAISEEKIAEGKNYISEDSVTEQALPRL